MSPRASPVGARFYSRSCGLATLRLQLEDVKVVNPTIQK